MQHKQGWLWVSGRLSSSGRPSSLLAVAPGFEARLLFFCYGRDIPSESSAVAENAWARAGRKSLQNRRAMGKLTALERRRDYSKQTAADILQHMSNHSTFTGTYQ